ncbi:MAG TPA: hypothetical protein VNQ81_08425 [Povalibacter sp.]|nr:hypothetical protein [Povalibacter sp.]
MAHRITHRPIVALLLLPLAQVALAAEPAGSHAGTANDPPRTEASPVRKPLDLRPPDITTLLSQAELDRILSRIVEENIEEVEVQRERTKAPNLGTPAVPLGIASPFWAIAHPLQAWRIFTPIPPDRAQYISAPADATDAYRRPIFFPP